MRGATDREVSNLPGASGLGNWTVPAPLLLVLAYVFSGKLGLMLALPPGYASSIFPPAGIALASVLARGQIRLPWIFLGSAILNLWIGCEGSQPFSVTCIEIALLIALASTVQAAAGGALLRRVLGWPTAMDHERPLIKFVLLTPIVCLISASGSVAALNMLGALQPEEVITNWVTWWTGDTLGVLVMLPLSLIFIGEPRALWRSRTLPVGLPIVIGMILFIVLFVRFSAWEKGQSLLEFNMLSQQVSDRVQTRLDAQLVLLEQVEGFLDSDAPVSREDFKRYIARTLARYPTVKAISWVPRISAVQRQAYEARNDIQIRDFPDGVPVARRAGAREVYYPITYIEPRAGGNEAVLGFDWITRVGKPALERASATRRAFITAPFQLVQDKQHPEAGPGALIICPVRDGANGPGFVASVLQLRQFIEGALPSVNGQLHVRLIDQRAGVVIYDSFQRGVDDFLFQTEFDFGGRHYFLQTSPSAAYLQTHRTWQSWGVLAIGLLFISLLASARLISTGQSARTEALVIERTADLADAKYFSDTVINSLPGVFYMLDASGKLVQWNENFRKAFGDNTEKMQAGDVLVTTTDEYRAAARKAISDVFQTKGYVEVELDQRLVSGELRRYLVSGKYIEISGKPYLVGTGIDVTARREMEQQVQRSQRVMRTLIDAAPTWLSMIDRDGKMVIANQRYAETFGLSIKGMKGRHYSSVFPAETSIRMETWLDECFAGKEVKFDDEWNVRGQATRFVHGRCVPIFEGEKVVSVVMAIMDLTEIQNAQSRLRSANAQLERRVEEVHALQAQLQEQAIRDPLSGLFNRRYMDETLDRELARALREGYPVGIVLCDIDYFKALNDNYGHQAGDEVIRSLARFLREQARASDILCRFGGEEFLLVLPGMSPENAVDRVDEWRRKFAERRTIFGSFELSVTLSFGISSYPAHGDTPELLIAAADQALYVAKRKGRNRTEHSEI